jgi:RHS repeat-associated protein
VRTTIGQFNRRSQFDRPRHQVDGRQPVEFDVLVTTLYGAAASDDQRTEHYVNNFYLGAYTSPPFRELSGALYRETFWLVPDHLGTPRMVVDRSGSLPGIRRHDYLPFGNELAAGTGGRVPSQGYSQTDGNRKRWAELERDDETGLDYAQARYFSCTQGRFTGVDPGNRQARRDIHDPQSWNGYTYVNNNPLGRIDPNGTDFWDKLKNAFFYGYWVENDQIATIEQERREWLSQYYYERDDEGNWRPFDTSKLSRQDVFDKYREVKYFYERGKLHELSDKEIIEAWSNANPALKDDPYHPDEVTKRQNNELNDLREKMQSTGMEAERLGFDRELPRRKRRSILTARKCLPTATGS